MDKEPKELKSNGNLNLKIFNDSVIFNNLCLQLTVINVLAGGASRLP